MRVTGSATIDKMVREIFSVALTYDLIRPFSPNILWFKSMEVRFGGGEGC